MALQIGDHVYAKGFVARLVHVLNKSPTVLEQRLGFRTDRLRQGWMLLLLLDVPKPDHVALAGSTTFSGGLTDVVTPAGVPLRARLDEVVRSRDSDYDRRHGLGSAVMKQNAVGNFVVSGPKRICKIVPTMPDMKVMPADEQYPPATDPIDQWVLTAEYRFVVAAIVARGSAYLGGGAGAGAFWVDDPLALQKMQ